MSLKTHCDLDFEFNLSLGKDGESSFFSHIKRTYPNIEIIHLSNSRNEALYRGPDFLIDGIPAELKSPQYPLHSLFIEMVSNTNTGRVGALERSSSDGCAYYIFWDSKNKDMAIYHTFDLLEFVQNNLESRQAKYVNNYLYRKKGYIFTREELKHLECSIHNKLGIFRSSVDLETLRKHIPHIFVNNH
ncbi:MAG: hypothetical protein IPM57_10405 [Oligoflexia bacterium]|nr:hypothetical protein [Oligoflexia bacterium]